MSNEFPTEISKLLSRISNLETHIANLEMNVIPLSQDQKSRLVTAVGLLQPKILSGDLVRVGGESDGGYIIEPPRIGSTVLSLGVGTEISADLQLIEHFGCEVHAFDPYVERPINAPMKFVFSQIGLGRNEIKAGLQFKTIDQILSTLPINPNLALIDIEGSELDLIDSFHHLRDVEQIVIEFHDLDQIIFEEFFLKFTALLQQILESHEPIHIHGNNDGPTLRIQGAIWPSIVEVSFRKKSAMEEKEFNFGPWPHQLDRPNNPARPDLCLEPFFGKSATYRPY
jgi:hypothetical protein